MKKNKILNSFYYNRGRLATFCKRIYYYIAWYNRERKFIIIHSIRKSGTNWMRIFLANYINCLYGHYNHPLGYHETSSIFPNEFHQYQTLKKKYIQPKALIRNTQYTDIVYGHFPELILFSKAKIIHLYRNPFDYAVSFYHYKHKNRNHENSLNDIIDSALLGPSGYIEVYKRMKELSRRKDNILRISYEHMKKQPTATFAILVNWLNLPMDYGALKKAIQYSDIKNVHKEEAKKGPIHSPEGFNGFFTRSGEIGQWKKEMDSETVNKITRLLEKSGVSVKEFIVE